MIDTDKGNFERISVQESLFELSQLTGEMKKRKRFRGWTQSATGKIQETRARILAATNMEESYKSVDEHTLRESMIHDFEVDGLKDHFGKIECLSLEEEEEYLSLFKLILKSVQGELCQLRDEAESENNEELKKKMLRDYLGKLLFLKNLKEKVGIQFSGGSKHGYALVGVLEVLQKEGIEFSDVTGVSAGSIFGAVIGSFYGLQNVDMELVREKMQLLLDNEIFDFKTFNPLRKEGLLDRSVLEGILQEFYGTEMKLSDVKGVNLKILATERDSGDLAIFSNTSGKTRDNKLWEAVMASCCVPVLYESMSAKKNVINTINGNSERIVDEKLLIDGSMIRDFFIEDMALCSDYVINVYINPLSDLVHNYDWPLKENVFNTFKKIAALYRDNLSEKIEERFIKKVASLEQSYLNTGILTFHHMLNNLPDRDAGGSADTLIVPKNLGLVDMLFLGEEKAKNMIEDGRVAAEMKISEIKKNLPILNLLNSLEFKNGGLFSEIKAVREMIS